MALVPLVTKITSAGPKVTVWIFTEVVTSADNVVTSTDGDNGGNTLPLRA